MDKHKLSKEVAEKNVPADTTSEVEFIVEGKNKDISLTIIDSNEEQTFTLDKEAAFILGKELLKACGKIDELEIGVLRSLDEAEQLMHSNKYNGYVSLTYFSKEWKSPYLTDFKSNMKILFDLDVRGFVDIYDKIVDNRMVRVIMLTESGRDAIT